MIPQLKYYDFKINDLAGQHIYDIQLENHEIHCVGLTGSLVRFAFPNTYAGVSEDVLKAAADRGSAVHEAFEKYFKYLVQNDKKAVHEGIALLEGAGLTNVANEYLVFHDGFATKVDNVSINKQDEVCLLDYKCTYAANEDKVALQLSYNAEWFEEINPGTKVSHIYLVWLSEKRGVYKLIELKRVPKAKLDEVVMAYAANDESYRYSVESEELPEYFLFRQEKLAWLLFEQKMIELKINEYKNDLLSYMQQEGIHSFTGSKMTVTLMEEKTSKRFDTKAFQSEHPEIYDKYLTDKKTKAFIHIVAK